MYNKYIMHNFKNDWSFARKNGIAYCEKVLFNTIAQLRVKINGMNRSQAFFN